MGREQDTIRQVQSQECRTKNGMARMLVIANLAKSAMAGAEVQLNGNRYFRGYIVGNGSQYMTKMSYENWLASLAHDAECHYAGRLAHGETWPGILQSLRCGIFDYGNVVVGIL